MKHSQCGTRQEDNTKEGEGKMSSFNEQLHRAEQHLRPESYDVCSILCGKTMELVLKELLQLYLQKTTQEEQLPIRKEIASLRKRSSDSLTAGEMANIFEKCNILRSFISTRKILIEDQRLPDLRTMVKIRNKATHDNVNDADLEKADAYVMYGSVLRLVKIADLLLSQHTREDTSEGAAVVRQKMAPRRLQTDDVMAATPPMARRDMLTLYRNRSSGKYFVFLEEEDAGKMLLIIPTGQIKALDQNLFESALEEEEKQALRRNLILAEQVKCYHEYVGYEDPLPRRVATVVTKPQEKVDNKPRDDHKRQTEEVFAYEVHGAKASLVCKHGAYIILKESTAVMEERASIPDNVQRIRRDLLRKGILVPDKITTRLKFTQDERFDSPSAASGVVSASSTNGWICFKLPNGKTLKHIMRRERV